MYINLYSSCQITYGATNCSIVDLQRKELYLIDKKLFELLKEGYLDLKSVLIPKDKMLKYKKFLLENDLGYLSELKNVIENLDLSWDFPATISNAILDFKFLDFGKLKSILKQLDELLCFYVEIRIYEEEIDFHKLKKLHSIINESKINSFDLFLAEETKLESLYIDYKDTMKENLFGNFTMLSRLVLFNSKKNENFFYNGKAIIRTTKKLSNKLCGMILPEFFSMNIKTFSESQSFNTCLNRKISIDLDGEIKNCPSFSNSFGNILDTSLKDVVENMSFKKKWNINKNQIETCKDCEFKHVCTDCRAFIENPKDIYSKPLKCGYNPYTGNWEKWSENPLKEKAIKFYELED